jgi:hypothetical protein
MAEELFNVGDTFEGFHGVLLLRGTKKPAGWAGMMGAVNGSFGYSYKIPRRPRLKLTGTVKPAGARGKAGTRGLS